MSGNKSTLKRLKQNEKRYRRNKKIRTIMKHAIKKVCFENSENVINVIKIISKAASKGVIHKKNASNKISKLMRRCSTIVE